MSSHVSYVTVTQQNFDHYISGILDIYHASFDDNELRSDAEFINLITNGQCNIIAISDQSNCLGFIVFWNLSPKVVFIEILCIHSDYRGSGLGTQVMKWFLEENKQNMVFLETHLAETERDKRRRNFYKNLGFLETGFPYIQPAYGTGKKPVIMEIFSTESIAEDTFNSTIKDLLYTLVYCKHIN